MSSTASTPGFEELVTAKEFAEMLGITVHALHARYRRNSRNQLPMSITCSPATGNRRLWRRQDVENYIAHNVKWTAQFK